FGALQGAKGTAGPFGQPLGLCKSLAYARFTFKRLVFSFFMFLERSIGAFAVKYLPRSGHPGAGLGAIRLYASMAVAFLMLKAIAVR
ncbi:MAG: hypothetical protein SV487_05885, partial [Thermodesulfobacteriota bacterium]|nr:hypothetical protein [Thermodesulfobacteriota bacterium]